MCLSLHMNSMKNSRGEGEHKCWVNFCCTDCRVGKKWKTFWAFQFIIEAAKFQVNRLSEFSYVDIR